MDMHTPGPWEADEDCGNSFSVCHGADTVVCRGIKREADARLIAAAPELLAVCRMAQMLRRLGGMLPGSHEVVQSVVEMADAAIARATGEI